MLAPIETTTRRNRCTGSACFPLASLTLADERQWEYSHAVNAALTFAALLAITSSTWTYKLDKAA
jgi:hypothetical protein